MRKEMQLRVDNPCSENWNEMVPTGQGRHCSSCQMIVVDFTAMTDQQLLEWFAARPSGGVCGRFYASQLVSAPEAPRASPVPPRAGRKGIFWQFLLAGLLFSARVSAQVPDTLRGQVVDTAGVPLPGASILWGRHGVLSDAHGNFVIPRAALGHRTKLTFGYVGYERQVVDVDKQWKDGAPVSITMKVVTLMGMTEIIVGRVAEQ